jgi:hypothetical protein
MIPLIVSLRVASSPEIDLGDDDDPDQVEIMLRVMYDDDTVYGLNVLDLKDPNFTKTYLDYYILGDKYDFPILRHQAKQMFLQDIGTCVNLRSENSFWNSESFDNSASRGCSVRLLPLSLIDQSRKKLLNGVPCISTSCFGIDIFASYLAKDVFSVQSSLDEFY